MQFGTGCKGLRIYSDYKRLRNVRLIGFRITVYSCSNDLLLQRCSMTVNDIIFRQLKEAMCGNIAERGSDSEVIARAIDQDFEF